MLISISIPEHAKCLLKSGQTVDIGMPFLQYSSSKLISLPLSKKLRIPAAKIFNHMKKFVGETIVKGELIAINKGFFSSTKIVSEFDGILKEIDHNEGLCVIETKDGEEKKILTYFKGEVEHVSKNEVVLKVKTAKEFPLKKTSLDFGGKVFYVKGSPEKSINEDCDNSVCVAETLTSYLQTKTEALGAIGFVTLHSIPGETVLPTALFKQIDHFKKVFERMDPYCIVDSKKGTITFYQI